MALQGLIILVAVLVNILITRNAEKAQLKQREARLSIMSKREF